MTVDGFRTHAREHTSDFPGLLSNSSSKACVAALVTRMIPVCVFAKPPVPDGVKTRLVPVLGNESAAALASAMFVDVWRVLVQIFLSVCLWRARFSRLQAAKTTAHISGAVIAFPVSGLRLN